MLDPLFAIVDGDPHLDDHPDLRDELNWLVDPDEAEFLFKSGGAEPGPGTPRAANQVPCKLAAGGMLALRWKTLSGSYLALIAWSRAYFGP